MGFKFSQRLDPHEQSEIRRAVQNALLLAPFVALGHGIEAADLVCGGHLRTVFFSR